MEWLRKVSDREFDLHLYVQPRSSRNTVCGLHDGCLKIALTTPPVNGRANKALINFLAKQLALSRGDISIKSGMKSRRKCIRITNVAEEDIRGRIRPLV